MLCVDVQSADLFKTRLGNFKFWKFQDLCSIGKPTLRESDSDLQTVFI